MFAVSSNRLIISHHIKPPEGRFITSKKLVFLFRGLLKLWNSLPKVGEARLSQSFKGRLGKFMKRNVLKISEHKENTCFSERSFLPYSHLKFRWLKHRDTARKKHHNVCLIFYSSLIMLLTTVEWDTGLDRNFWLPCTDTLYILMLCSLPTSKK